jgi:YD repeat-containing protein
MTEVWQGGQKPLAAYAYDAYGRRAKLTRDNGVTTNYAYDAAGQIFAIDCQQAVKIDPVAGAKT